jgi:hypothetical protein
MIAVVVLVGCSKKKTDPPPEPDRSFGARAA